MRNLNGTAEQTPPPMFTSEGFKPLPPTGARTLDSRTAFYYGYTMDSPGLIMRLPNVGSQYLIGFMDANKEYFDGAKTYKVTLPPNVPAKNFWVLHCLRQPDALYAPDAAAIPPSREAELPDARRRRKR